MKQQDRWSLWLLYQLLYHCLGRTIYLALRDRQHRTRQNDTVYKFAKEYIMEIAKKYNSKSELMKNNKSVYDAAQRYGWLKEIDLLYEKI